MKEHKKGTIRTVNRIIDTLWKLSWKGALIYLLIRFVISV